MLSSISVNSCGVPCCFEAVLLALNLVLLGWPLARDSVLVLASGLSPSRIGRLSASFKDYLSTPPDEGPPRTSNTDTEAAAHTALTSALSTAVLQGRARALDPELASRVAGGGIERRRLGQCSHHLLPHANEERAGATRECATHR